MTAADQERLRSDAKGAREQASCGGERPAGHRLFARVCFVCICGEAVFAVPYRSVYLAFHSVRLAWAVAIALCAAVYLGYGSAEMLLAPVRRALLRAEGRRWRSLLLWLIAGVAVRLAWALRYSRGLKSDGLAYYLEGALLASKHTYSGAFWPPGFPLFLAAFMTVLGVHVWVATLCSLLLFIATYWTTYLLAEQLVGGRASLIAAVMTAVWPTYIALTGVNAKETLLAPLVTGAFFLYLKADDRGRGYRSLFVVLAGFLIGCAALTQPSYLLFVGVIFALERMRGRSLTKVAGRTVLFGAAVMVTVLPWTYRNYVSFHRFALISNNGGSVFYRANNAKANASYAAEGEQVLPQDEFAADREGYRAAERWILDNPRSFAVLIARKQIVYIGDDGIGVYESLKRDLHPSVRVYGAAKAICNLFWLAAWIVLLLGTSSLFGSPKWVLWLGVCMLPLVYQWAIDSVFESGGRHHVPYIGLISIMVGIVLSASASSRAERAKKREPGQVLRLSE